MVRRIAASVAGAIIALSLIAGPAGASATSHELCSDVAELTSGSGVHVLNKNMFRLLLHSRDSGLADIASTLSKNSKDEDGLHDFRDWCRSHYPKDKTIQKSDFEY